MANKNIKNQQKVIELHTDNSIRNIWVDNLHLAIRDDGVCVARLSASLPEGLFEQLRFVTNRSQLEEFTEILCATMNYYPQKDKAPSIKKKQNHHI
jgi:hypothetical protein